jgi:hypothetical protein
VSPAWGDTSSGEDEEELGYPYTARVIVKWISKPLWKAVWQFLKKLKIAGRQWLTL